MAEVKREKAKLVSVNTSRFKISDDGTQGVLLGRKCKSCGTYFFGSPRFCLNCSSDQLEPVELSNHGVLMSWTIVYQAPPGFLGNVPYMLGVVQLPEGQNVTVHAEVIDVPFEEVKAGMPLELTMKIGGKDQEGNEVAVYKWKPKTGR
jgi:uncharacterized OB-fold protein